VCDLRLAERLEFARPRDIRQLIERNREELERHGGLRYGAANPGSQGGRPSTEYWLNEAQAVLLCMRSDAPRAFLLGQVRTRAPPPRQLQPLSHAETPGLL
jgi:hypothetical protein